LKRLAGVIHSLRLLFAQTCVVLDSLTDEHPDEPPDCLGSLSSTEWLKHNCHLTTGEATQLLRVGRFQDSLPASVAALHCGEIGFGHISQIALAAKKLADSESLNAGVFEETTLLERARECTPSKLMHLVPHYVHSKDPSVLAREEYEALMSRFLRVSAHDDGVTTFTGRLGNADGALILTALEPLSKRSGPDDDRLLEQRHADALVDLARRALNAGDLPKVGGQRPHITVTATMESLRGLPGCEGADLERGLPISKYYLQYLSCDASITRVILGAKSAVLDVGRAVRTVSPALRRALAARDGGCIFPGCNRRASFTDAHHILHWARGGTSVIENLCLLCARHHLAVHLGLFQVVRAEDRILVLHHEEWRRQRINSPPLLLN
jgi:hypothetical protein